MTPHQRRNSEATTTEQELEQGRAELWASGWSEVMKELTQKKAYHLWEMAGRPSGDGIELWLLAEHEMRRQAAYGEKVGQLEIPGKGFIA